jgi:hypothetical protein
MCLYLTASGSIDHVRTYRSVNAMKLLTHGLFFLSLLTTSLAQQQPLRDESKAHKYNVTLDVSSILELRLLY